MFLSLRSRACGLRLSFHVPARFESCAERSGCDVPARDLVRGDPVLLEGRQSQLQGGRVGACRR